MPFVSNADAGSTVPKRLIDIARRRAPDREDANRPVTRAPESALAEADLVICQAGCVSHDDYWRAGDDCVRKGKQCVLVDHPHALFRAGEAANVSDDGNGSNRSMAENEFRSRDVPEAIDSLLQKVVSG